MFLAAQRCCVAAHQDFLEGQCVHGSPMPHTSTGRPFLGPLPHLECLEKWQALVGALYSCMYVHHTSEFLIAVQQTV